MATIPFIIVCGSVVHVTQKLKDARTHAISLLERERNIFIHGELLVREYRQPSLSLSRSPPLLIEVTLVYSDPNIFSVLLQRERER